MSGCGAGAEKAAADRDPAWERQEHQSVREYMLGLAERLPVDHGAVETFADLHEKARFGDDELTLDEYTEAMRAFVDIMQAYALTGIRRRAAAVQVD